MRFEMYRSSHVAGQTSNCRKCQSFAFSPNGLICPVGWRSVRACAVRCMVCVERGAYLKGRFELLRKRHFAARRAAHQPSHARPGGCAAAPQALPAHQPKGSGQGENCTRFTASGSSLRRQARAFLHFRSNGTSYPWPGCSTMNLLGTCRYKGLPAMPLFDGSCSLYSVAACRGPGVVRTQQQTRQLDEHMGAGI